ncbi:MAG: LysR family transcriptional regulator [Pseudomonadota bacterium]
MPDLDWNDLKLVLALARTGRFAAAARRLGRDETTVARRLRAAEAALGAPLFARRPDGRLAATPAGRDALIHAEAMERQAQALADALADRAARTEHRVRLSATPLVVDRILLPALPDLLARRPSLSLELVPEAQNIDLAQREADLALRLARPRDGGLGARARRLGALAHLPAAAAGLTPEKAQTLPWILYDAARSALPPARWLARAAQAHGAAPLRAADARTALDAAALGLGRALLPALALASDSRLQALPAPPDLPPPPLREVWLLSPAAAPPRPAEQAVRDWLAGLPWSAAPQISSASGQ